MEDVAIVTSGGGMSCSYSVGVLLALIDKFGLTRPKLVVGSSGSTGTLAYYVSSYESGRYHCFRNIWECLITDRRFIDLRRRSRMMDIDYLIDEVFKKQEPLDIEALNNSPITFFVSVTNCRTGGIEYFSNKEGLDFFEVLRASKAAPVVYGKRVMIRGQEYIDGALYTPIQMNISKAISEGARTVVAIDNSNDSAMNSVCLLSYATFAGRALRGAIVRSCLSRNEIVSLPARVFLIRPRGKIVGSLDNRKQRVKRTIDIGYEETMENQELAEFLAN